MESEAKQGKDSQNAQDRPVKSGLFVFKGDKTMWVLTWAEYDAGDPYYPVEDSNGFERFQTIEDAFEFIRINWPESCNEIIKSLQKTGEFKHSAGFDYIRIHYAYERSNMPRNGGEEPNQTKGNKHGH